MKNFDLTESYTTYATKPDRSNTDRRFLTKGSQNVLINDAEKVSTRYGYTILGAEGTSGTPIAGKFDWETSGIGGTDPVDLSIPVRSYGTVLEAYLGTIGAIEFNSWETLKSSLTKVAFVFDSYWDNTEKIDRAIGCNGSADLYDWSGGLATFASATTNTVTIQGSLTIGNRRFLTAGTRQIRIKDSSGTWRTFTYTGGESGTTFTGVTSDPTAFTFTVGAPIMQEVIVRSNKPAALFKADFLKVINNQAHIGSRTSRTVYISQNDDIGDYTFSTPRIAGEGGLVTLDQAGRGISVIREFAIYFTSDFRYRIELREITVSTTLTEALLVKRLKGSARQGAMHHNMIASDENGISYMSPDKQVFILEDVNNTDQPLVTNLSDIIQPDFDAMDITYGQFQKHKSRIYICLPEEGKTYINETREGVDDNGNVRKKRFWQPPQTIPLAFAAVIDGNICGHSSAASESYTLFSGLRDRINLTTEFDDQNGQPYIKVLRLAKYHASEREMLKNTEKIYTEGRIARNTDIIATYVFEKDKGETLSTSKPIQGDDIRIIYQLSEDDEALGDLDLGEESLSGDIEEELIPKFRIIHAINPVNYFDLEETFSSEDIDEYWEILATGPQTTAANAHPSAISQ